MTKPAIKGYKKWFMRLIPIACIFALTIGLSEMFYQNMIRSTEEKCWDDLYTVCDEAARDMAEQITTNISLLELAADAIVMNADFSSLDNVCDYLTTVQKETIFDRIDVFFPNGTILVTSQRKNIRNNEANKFEDLLARGEHLSLRSADFLTGEQAIHAFSPVYDGEEKPMAILSATIYCSTVEKVFYNAHYGEAAQLFIVDRRDGNLILDKWHEVPGSIYDMSTYQTSEENDFISEILAGERGRISYISQMYKDTSYTVYTPIEGTDFSLTMVLQEDTVMSNVNDLRKTFVFVGVVEVVLLSLLVIWVYFIMLRSVQNERRAQKAELELLHKKELELQTMFEDASNRKEFLELLAVNLPGGYHRCTTDHSFIVTFMSRSFTQITGYTMEQLEKELDGSYINLVLDEDRDYFMSLAPQLEIDKYISCAYRIRRRDGVIRWVQDATQYVERDEEHYYQCSLMDISERVEELEKSRYAAEESSRAKSAFLFNISHDIRTPMNAIKGFSRIIGENAGNEELVEQTAKKIDQAGNSLMMLINDVLDISRIERGKEELTLRAVNLYSLGKNLYEMFASDMSTAGIDFSAEGEPLRDNVYCDELKLTRIMMNMLSNAKKFTPVGGTVTFGGTRLSSDEKSCTYRFFVKDSGIGMSPEFKKRAFEQFERERTSTESGITGSGLGLAIIKMLVDLMGGTVEIQSELGRGTEISAVLTFSKVESDSEQEADVTQSSADIAGKRVLLVEDNAFNREIAKYMLENMQLLVEEAENGELCLEKLTTAPYGYYDVILMDIQMPVMDGYTATAKIRKLDDKQKAGIPIVAMTANAFDEDKRKCLESGMNEHIGKPIDVETLTRVLKKIIK